MLPVLSVCFRSRVVAGVTRVKSNRPRGGNQPQRTWVLDGNNSENPPFLFSCKSGAFATPTVCSSKTHTCHVLNFRLGAVCVAKAPLLHLFEKHPERGIHLGSKIGAEERLRRQRTACGAETPRRPPRTSSLHGNDNGTTLG